MVNRKKFFICDEYTRGIARLAAESTGRSELARLCQRMYIADYINLDGIDLWLAKNALTTLFQVLKKYPALRGYVNYFGSLNGLASRKDDLFAYLHPSSDSYVRDRFKKQSDELVASARVTLDGAGLAMAFYYYIGPYKFSGIILDENDFDERKVLKNIEYSSKIGYSPEGCISCRSIIDHEIGHLLDFSLSLSSSSEFKRIIGRYNADYIGKNLSMYCVETGKIDYAEVIAEGFSEFRNNGTPRCIAREIGELIDREYKIQEAYMNQ